MKASKVLAVDIFDTKLEFKYWAYDYRRYKYKQSSHASSLRYGDFGRN